MDRDRALEQRMLSALSHAGAMLVTDPRFGPPTWGREGRTVGATVRSEQMTARWLRLVGVPEVMGREKFWNGAALAQVLVPATVRRPRLHAATSWFHEGFYYRAELFDLVEHPVLARGDACLRTEPDLSEDWWHGIVTTVDTMPTVPTDRVAVRQGYLRWAMTTYLGIPVDTRALTWTTAHGDLHWANLTAGAGFVLDWERWGRAPDGWDAAMLHTYSLLVPSIAAEIRHRFRHVLGTPEGRFAELAVMAEVLHFAVDNGVLGDLIEPMRRRAADVLKA